MGVDKLSDSLNVYGSPFPETWRKVQNMASEQLIQCMAYLGLKSPFSSSTPTPPVASHPPSRLPSAITSFFDHVFPAERMPSRKIIVYTMGGIICVGLGVLTMPYVSTYVQHHLRSSRLPLKGAISKDGTRRQCVIVLGGDTILGSEFVRHFLAHDLIVLASASTEQSVRELESNVPSESQGYIRLFQLNPVAASDKEMTKFVHAIHASLCMRFPWNVTGDPYARPGSTVELVGIVNALSYVPDMIDWTSHSGNTESPLAALEPKDVDAALHKHVSAPLSVLSRLLTLVTTSKPHKPSNLPILVVHIVSLPGARFVWPAHGATAMIAQAAQTGFTSLRREYTQEWMASLTSTHVPWHQNTGMERKISWTTFQVGPGAMTSSGVSRLLPKVTRLILTPVRSLSLSYTIFGGSLWHAMVMRCIHAALRIVPTTWLDVIISVHERFLERHNTRARVQQAHANPHPSSLQPGVTM